MYSNTRKSENLVERCPRIGRGPGPAQAEGNTDAHRAGYRVAFQMSVEFPPGGVDSGYPLPCWGFRIGGLSGNCRRQHGPDRGLRGDGFRSWNFNGRGRA